MSCSVRVRACVCLRRRVRSGWALPLLAGLRVPCARQRVPKLPRVCRTDPMCVWLSLGAEKCVCAAAQLTHPFNSAQPSCCGSERACAASESRILKDDYSFHWFVGELLFFFLNFILIVWVIRKKRPPPPLVLWHSKKKKANFYFFCFNIYARSGCIAVSPPSAPVAWIKTTSQQVYCLNRFRHAGQHLNLKSAKTSLEILYSTLIFKQPTACGH